jgi:hypothetical protein
MDAAPPVAQMTFQNALHSGQMPEGGMDAAQPVASAPAVKARASVVQKGVNPAPLQKTALRRSFAIDIPRKA